MRKKCSTGQRFTCIDVTSYKIHTLVNYLDLERLLDLEPPLLHEKSDKMTTKNNLSRIILRFIKLISDFLMDFLGNKDFENYLNNCLFLSILPNVIKTRD